MAKSKKILLSFDTEEFDLPREQGVDISFEESVRVSAAGSEVILDMLEQQGVRATFFCTVRFACAAPAVMERIVAGGHEVASHGVDHWEQRAGDAAQSRTELERLTGQPVTGYRQPRMMAIDNGELARAGYRYNSSVHPTFIPGRYMHLNVPRVPFVEGGLPQIPVSVTPWLRLPLFWLACHNYPQWLYRRLCLRTLRHDGHFAIYFHPWEFVALGEHREWRTPWIIRRNSGHGMAQRLRRLIADFKAHGAEFVTYNDFVSCQ
ncbi:MAG: polysaccharide deacetylase family protein [Muribaculaceae bacterium]|nr:polysaccharide deacetylase family protein [Muribaculaceae bacterium]